MCKECGCGLPGENPVGIDAHHHDHDHGHGHDHHHDHDHNHPHSHTHSHEEADHDHLHGTAVGKHRILEVHRAILEKNDRLAERNRGFFQARGLLVLNVLSSPGSGKTRLIRETVRSLGKRLKTGVIVGDLATDNDAQRLRESGAPVVQITTGTVCHLEAEMVARALKQLDLTGLNLLIIENVGNLVCPASYDLGEDLRVVLLSVTEGEDKPLKYPSIFFKSELMLLTKIDLLPYVPFSADLARENARRVHPGMEIIDVSSTTGEGLDRWMEWLKARQEKARLQRVAGS